ncbi:MAG: hypothetical protein HOP15_06210 [Planctomycetes bacterium]|nr:hypothetical protein [Planctomycetota bacterium]
MAFLLSFGLPGLGQLYCGRLGRGIAFFVATLIAWPLSWCALGWVAHLVAALDAARLASQKGKGARS